MFKDWRQRIKSWWNNSPDVQVIRVKFPQKLNPEPKPFFFKGYVLAEDKQEYRKIGKQGNSAHLTFPEEWMGEFPNEKVKLFLAQTNVKMLIFQEVKQNA
jgi:hypothetical protein